MARVAIPRVVGEFVVRRYARAATFVLALTAFNVFWRLPSAVVSDSDEARYGVAAYEMLQSGHPLVPTYAGGVEYWNLKPPLGYWFMELSFAVFGPTVFALRLPSALCALGVVALTMTVCRRWYGRRVAILAGLVMATCFGFFSHHGARSGDLDAALTLVLLAALAGIPVLAANGWRPFVWALWLSIGFLIKSFAIVPLVGVTLAFSLWTGDWRRARWRSWWPALTLFVVTAAGWAAARSFSDGSITFVTRMVSEDLFQRATRTIDSVTYVPWAYAGSLIDRLAPWPLVGAAAWIASRGRNTSRLRSRLGRLLVLAVFVPLLLFSIARTHHHWYLDPTYPAWAMLAGVATEGLLRRARGNVAGVLATGLLALVVAGCEIRLIVRAGVTDRAPSAQVFLRSLRRPMPRQALYATSVLRHSERFLLQVVDGFDVHEPTGDPFSWTPPPGALVLVSKASVGVSRWLPIAGARTVAENVDYLLVVVPG